MMTSSSPSPSAKPGPNPFVQSLNFWARDACIESAGMHAAHRLGILRSLPDEGEPGVTLIEVAERTGCIPRGVRSVLEPLVGIGVIRMDEARRYTLTSSHAFLRQEVWQALLSNAANGFAPSKLLPDAIRSGQPARHGGDIVDLVARYREVFLDPSELPTRGPEAEAFFDRFARNFLRTQALITAGELGVLTALVSKDRSEIGGLSRELQVSEPALEVLLRVLRQLDFVAIDGSEVRLSDSARAVLDEKSLSYYLRALPATTVYWDGLSRLDEAIEAGRFVLDLKVPETARLVYLENAERITGIFASHLQLGRRAASIVARVKPLTGARVLDVGTGSGVWGAAFALQDPTVRVTYLDSDYVLDRARRNLEALQLGERAEYWAGDCLTVDYGTASYDFVLLPQIVPVLRPHELPDLLDRAARALRPGGLLIISGYVLNDRRDGPMDALYFSLRRYMTNEGDVLSFPEFQEKLARVGLSHARCYSLPVQEMILAGRGDVPLPDLPSPLAGGGRYSR